jgi:myb proto-oncogene protein
MAQFYLRILHIEQVFDISGSFDDQFILYCNLLQVKQNYKVSNGEAISRNGQGQEDRKEMQKGFRKGSEMGIPLSRGLQDPNMLDPARKTTRGGFGAVDFAKLKSKTVQEAARVAALAVAEAEAAAAAAEKAAKEAEAAEAEAEAAELAAELAALAARPSKKGLR